MSADSFKIRYSELNTTNLQDLNSDIKVIDKNNVFNKSISVSITSSQINNLSTTPVLILPAPGKSHYYTINNVSLYQNFTGSSYNSITTMELYYGLTGEFPTNSGLTSFVDDILTDNIDGQYGYSTSSSVGNALTYVNINNPIYLSGNYNSGNSNIKLNVNYNILQI